ncbi:MAG TPA: MauE/DoxX family redox-associated membrane protein [Phycisphaerales bacterium]|nr:MauE/DoxX family redox-associated membrane protein [Phycisphaerales bacterium]
MGQGALSNTTARGALCMTMRFLLGAAFLAAGILKLSDPQGFAFAVKGFRVLPDHLVIPATYAIPWTEVFAGVLLLLGLWSRAAALVLSAMLAGFIAGLASVILRKMDVSCACFGDLQFPCGHSVGWCQIIRNVVMLGMAAPVLLWGPGAMALERPCRRGACGCAGSPAGVSASA